MKGLKVFLLSFVLMLGVGLVTLAQEEFTTPEVTPEVTEAINLDENIQPEDLGVSEPRLLPDSPFYFLKNWGRGIRSFFAFSPVTKSELKLRFANEKLIEVKKLAEKKGSPEIIKKAIENYQEEIEKIKLASDKIKDKASENPKVGKFLDKFIKQQVLHQRILEKLETQVPAEVFEKIQAARERHLERFGQVMQKLEDKTKLGDRLDKNLEELQGSKFKHFKNLEILLKLEEKVPEEAKDAIRRAQENALKRLKGNLEQMSPEDQEKFKEYLERIGGLRETQLEILENLREELKERPEIKERIMEIREKILEMIEEKAEELNCPAIEKPAPDFCQKGRIVIKRDEQGCPISFGCIIPGEITIPERPGVDCIALWNPVCGKDGKTYSNTCFAKAAGVEIDYKGICQKRETFRGEGCPLPVARPGILCIQVITYAKNPETGECCLYSNPCVAPEGWSKFYSLEECHAGKQSTGD